MAAKRTQFKKRSQAFEVWKRLRRNKMAILGMGVVLFLILIAVFADVIAPYDPAATDFSARLQMPSRAHWFGTDNLGRDILSRVIYGGRTSLLVAALAELMAMVAGCFFGLTAAYFGGKYEALVMRLNDILMAIPTMLLAICVSAVLGTGTINTAIAVAIGGLPGFIRLMRASALTIKNQEYVEAARAIGSGNGHIMRVHLLPNTLSTIIVQATMGVGGCIMAISGLSFIGLGVQPPIAEWGSMLTGGREFLRDFWPLATFPGLAIALTLFGFNIFGDGLRDALDPRLRQ